jgi:hypothetical protein
MQEQGKDLAVETTKEFQQLGHLTLSSKHNEAHIHQS